MPRTGPRFCFVGSQDPEDNWMSEIFNGYEVPLEKRL